MLHIMIDTNTVETNRQKTINKHLRKKQHARFKMMIADLLVAKDIFFKARFKGGKRY